MRPTSASDTPPEVTAILVAGYRAMSPSKKLRRVMELNHVTEAIARARLRRQYGTLDERTLQLRLAALRYPPELMIAAFGWDPRREGY
ncbi:MAG TPA: hypothetical protein VNB06_04815 [Thermoanaerobaculia bacterium]|nr:hypothetical protein [Thermoanaerobaculia bacterium]